MTASKDAVQAPLPTPVAAPALPATQGLLQLDTVLGLRSFNGRVDRYQKMLIRFVDLYAENGTHIQAVLANGDRQTAQRMAHSLKGAAGALGLSEVQHLATEAEQLIKNAAASALLTQVLTGLQHSLTLAVEEIVVYCMPRTE